MHVIAVGFLAVIPSTLRVLACVTATREEPLRSPQRGRPFQPADTPTSIMSCPALRPITASSDRVGALWGLILLTSIAEGNCVLGAAVNSGAAVGGLCIANTGPAAGAHALAPGRDSQARMCLQGGIRSKILLTIDLAAC
jgi:hypothetical protein